MKTKLTKKQIKDLIAQAEKYGKSDEIIAFLEEKDGKLFQFKVFCKMHKK